MCTERRKKKRNETEKLKRISYFLYMCTPLIPQDKIMLPGTK